MNTALQNKDHFSSRSISVLVFLMLCALTGLSFWISRSHLMDNHLTGWTAMIGVSVAKAALVVLFFMHLWWERAWKYVLTIPTIIMGTLLVLLLVPDIGFRNQTYSKERSDSAAEGGRSAPVSRDSLNAFSEDLS